MLAGAFRRYCWSPLHDLPHFLETIFVSFAAKQAPPSSTPFLMLTSLTSGWVVVLAKVIVLPIAAITVAAGIVKGPIIGPVAPSSVGHAPCRILPPSACWAAPHVRRRCWS